jgi:nitroreductase
MDALEAIFSRRSIRAYTDEPVAEQDITDLLRAAMSAPSAGNEQPWHFVVLRERAMLDAIPKFHPYSNMLRHTSVAILVCGDLSKEVYKGYWVQDCAAATQNMLVAITAKGLGAVWLGIYPTEERVQGCRQLLGLPDNIVPFSLIPVGYPAEQKSPANRYDAARIHFDRWGKP